MTTIGMDARLIAYRDGGTSTYIRQLITALVLLDAENHYTIYHSRKDKHRLTSYFERGTLWTPPHHRLERLALTVELAWRNLDVFHSPDFIPPLRAARKHIITVHDLTFLHYPQYLTADSRAYYNDQIATACRHADHILAVSAATQADLINMLQVPQDKISVQPHGVDMRFQPLPREQVQPVLNQLGLPSEYILHVGTWEPRKNILGLLRAYKQLITEMPDAPPVVLVGRPGWLFDESRAKIDALNLNDRLYWCDTVTDAQLPAVCNGALANVTVSHYEGFGMPALEGMACGVVPIVSDRSSLPEVVGDVGVQVNPDDLDDIASALHHVLADSTWRAEQRQMALQRAKTFTWERSAQIARDAYTSFG